MDGNEMSQDEREDKFKLQTGELYAGLGRFVVNFEEMVAAMRQVISLHVGNVPSPFHAKQQQVANIFTADLTAAPLVRAFRSILLLTLENYKNIEQVPEVERMLSSLCSQIDSVNQKRNKFLHGTWLINYASVDQQDFSVAQGIKASNTAKGLRLEKLEHTEDSFLETSEECLALKDLIFGFGICLLQDYDILSIYEIRDKKLVKLQFAV